MLFIIFSDNTEIEIQSDMQTSSQLKEREKQRVLAQRMQNDWLIWKAVLKSQDKIKVLQTD